jgi:hypothetical protein
MAKKIILIISLFLPLLSFGSFNVSQIGNNQINVSADASSDFGGYDYWTLILSPQSSAPCSQDPTLSFFLPNAPIVLPSTTLNNVFTYNELPAGNYFPVIEADYTPQTLLSNVCYLAEFAWDNFPNLYFYMGETTATPTITYPTGTAQNILAKVSDTLNDNGFLYIIIAAAAIPLVFYVAGRIIGLIPKPKNKRK